MHTFCTNKSLLFFTHDDDDDDVCVWHAQISDSGLCVPVHASIFSLWENEEEREWRLKGK